MSTISTTQLTEQSLEGVGVFDVLMKASTVHLDREHKLGRIKGTEYSQVYLGMMQANLAQAVQFLLSREKAGYEADLVEQQVLLTRQEELNAVQRVFLTTQEVLNAGKQFDVLQAQESKLDAERDLLLEQKLKAVAETTLLGQQTATELAQVDGAHVTDDSIIGNQAALSSAQKTNLDAEYDVLLEQKLKVIAETTLLSQKNETELAQINADRVATDSVIGNQSALTVAQKCKLDAEYDVLMEQKLKVLAETSLLGQKKETEFAQINGGNVTENSVIGKQTALYAAQTEGFEKDSQQKAAKLMVDAFSVRATTKPDETEGNGTNHLDDAAIGQIVTQMAAGVGITI